MRFEYGERELYNQLLYLRNIFDVDRGVEMEWNDDLGSGADEKVNGKVEGTTVEEKDNLRALKEHNRVRFTSAKKVVDGYLAKCGRVWVQMDGIFGFALR